MDYGTGRIGEIIKALQITHNINSVKLIPAKIKLEALCDALQLTTEQLDNLIIDNSPVMRTVKGHAFEAFFDKLVNDSGYIITEVGGDKAVDRILNKHNLQLKTPTVSGTKGNIVQYKTHKTHGAKSETESLDYYHKLDDFAEYLVGLVSYDPLQILILRKYELPTHKKSSKHIKSPFSLDWKNSSAMNAFDRLGINNIIDHKSLVPTDDELLPRCATRLNITSDIILNTILNEANFRIWDMTIRGFARECAFVAFLKSNNIKIWQPSIIRSKRADKSDLAIQGIKNKKYYFLQIKGLSINNCNITINNPIIAVETQLTRGRVNDHATQSRLYLTSDFDYLIIAIDPTITLICEKAIGNMNAKLIWHFYAIPTSALGKHPKMPHRLKSLQSFYYKDLQKYLINKEWCSKYSTVSSE